MSAQLQEPCFAFALNLEALVLLDDRFGYIWIILDLSEGSEGIF